MIIMPRFSSDDAPAAKLAIAADEKALRQRVLRNPGVRALIVSRFASVLGIATLSYGAMIYLATIGAPQFVISLMGATRYFAALLFGIGGGALADAMSKRTAMVTAYALQAAACFIIPTVWGTSMPSLIVLIFVVSLLGQIVTPAVKAATALVTSAAQVAVVAAIISVAGGIGSAIGTAFLAPLLINFGTLQSVAYVSGDPRLRRRARLVGALGRSNPPRCGTRRELSIGEARSQPCAARPNGCLANRKVGVMILVGSIVVALFDGLNTLMPVYVRDVLDTNPTERCLHPGPGRHRLHGGTGARSLADGPSWGARLGVMALLCSVSASCSSG